MAIQEHHQNPPLILLEALYCEEERWEEEEEEFEEEGAQETYSSGNNNVRNPSLFPLLLLEQDMFWEDEELVSLFSKEQQQMGNNVGIMLTESSNSVARGEAVEWMLKVNAHYGFTALTAMLSVNYLDRFLCSHHFQRDNKPWMMQLLAVTCLSLAAKVEETQVPLLLDLQVEDCKYLFEAKTIQRMELLVLSALQWKMHPVTPISFLDHIMRRLGLKTHLHWEFLRRCERLLLSLLFDSRIAGCLPSVLATATMMHVIDQVEPRNCIDYQNQLLGVLKISKEKVMDCYELILEISKTHLHGHENAHKRKYDQIPSSPSGVIDANLSSDSSNDSWTLEQSASPLPELALKRRRAQDRQQQMHLPSLNRVFVDILGSPH